MGPEFVGARVYFDLVPAEVENTPKWWPAARSRLRDPRPGRR
jgi:hypothetical protein